jgi:hypothetical protein
MTNSKEIKDFIKNYSKDDTGRMKKLLDMLKNSDCETLKDKMKLVMNTFISARQMGECEACYKVMPNFRLKDSNVTTIIVPTGTKETRSKFMIKVPDDFDYNGREKKMIAGKDGWYLEKCDLVDKYVRRDKICLAARKSVYLTVGMRMKMSSWMISLKRILT